MKYILYILAFIFLLTGAAYGQCICPYLITVECTGVPVKQHCAELYEVRWQPRECFLDEFLWVQSVQFSLPPEPCIGIQPYTIFTDFQYHISDGQTTFCTYIIEENVFIPEP